MENFILHLTTMTNGGAALGRHEGRAVFVPYALPGETVRVELSQERGRYAFARLLEVLEPATERVAPACPYFGRCGGCQWQHAAYAAQLRFKAAIVADQLSRIGQIADPPVRPTLPDPTGWAYRNHAQFHPAPGGGLGFQTAAGDQTVRIDACPLLHPLLADLYRELDLEGEVDGLVRLSLRGGVETGDRMVVFEMEDDLPPALEIDLPVSCVLLLSDGLHVNLIGHNHITERVTGTEYRISAPSFFQVNSAQAAHLVRLVLDFLNLRGDEEVLDAYCGVGLFTVPLAARAGRVIGVEQAACAVADLLENTAAFGNVDVIEGAVEDALPDVLVEGPLDAAVLDPPRAGLERRALDALVADGPARLVYVSCDPATLARDAGRLARAGYRLVEVQPVDMFPQTCHIECVARFERT